MDAREIFETTKNFLETNLDDGDRFPLIVSMADSEKSKIGITVQNNYPLNTIERSYGIPFSGFRKDGMELIAEVDKIHGYKWSIDTHEAMFKSSMEQHIHRQDGMQQQIEMKLSTGLGNVLQNLRSVAYMDNTLYMVHGERPDLPIPYPCLVNFYDEKEKKDDISIELLHFNELARIQIINKDNYIDSPVKASLEANKNNGNKILRWAVSGYPLILNGEFVPLEMIVGNVSDFRHIWNLPRLKKSLVSHIAEKSGITDASKKIEFHLGFDEIREKRNFMRAIKGKKLTFPLELIMNREWMEIIGNVCKINIEDLKNLDIFNRDKYAFQLRADEIKEDFKGYEQVPVREDLNEGEFYIDYQNNEVGVHLKPAIYPQHIVGIYQKNQKKYVTNISIPGKSARSGITIKNAQKLCKEIELSDALIFDNGNDVFADYEGQTTYTNSENTRHTRLTAALHFGDVVNPGPLNGVNTYINEVSIVKKPF